MANWERVLTVEDDVDYKNSSIEAADLPAHSGALITSGTVAAGRVATLNQNTTGSSATCSGNSATATKISSITNSNIVQLTASQTLTNKNISYGQITSAPWTTNTGTVTSVATSGTVSGITLTGGTITGSGTITLGGSISTLNQNTTGSSASCTGTAANATVLSNTRTFRTNLSSTSFANFNGGANVTPGVTGILPVSYGGTGGTGKTGTGKVVLWDSPSLIGSPIIGGTTFPSSTGTAKQILENNGLGSAAWADNFPNNVKYFYQQWSMRWYMRYGYAYYPSTSYGPGYYNWNKYSISPITSWLDSWNLGYVVPESATFKGAELLGSTNNTETLQLKILKGTPSSYSNSSTSVTIGSIYAPTAESFTSGRRNSMGSTSAVSVSVSKGDIIVPQLNKTSNINSTTRYLYGTLVLKFQKA